MEFGELVSRALDVRERYFELERRLYGRSWDRQQVMLGVMGDMGEIARLTQAENGVRWIEDSHAKLRTELSDCMWALISLAHLHGIDIEEAFMQNMDDLERDTLALERETSRLLGTTAGAPPS